MTDQWTKAREAACIAIRDNLREGGLLPAYTDAGPNGQKPILLHLLETGGLDAALSALREHGWEVRKITAKDIMQESALRTARNEALEEAAAVADEIRYKYPKTAFEIGYDGGCEDVAISIRALKHKDGQP